MSLDGQVPRTSVEIDRPPKVPLTMGQRRRIRKVTVTRAMLELKSRSWGTKTNSLDKAAGVGDIAEHKEARRVFDGLSLPFDRTGESCAALPILS